MRKSNSFQKVPPQSNIQHATTTTQLTSIQQQQQQQYPHPHQPITSPPIPDPDYSLSESDGEDNEENSIMLARNTKYNAKNLSEIPPQPIENSGTSNTR